MTHCNCKIQLTKNHGYLTSYHYFSVIFFVRFVQIRLKHVRIDYEECEFIMCFIVEFIQWMGIWFSPKKYELFGGNNCQEKRETLIY